MSRFLRRQIRVYTPAASLTVNGMECVGVLAYGFVQGRTDRVSSKGTNCRLIASTPVKLLTKKRRPTKPFTED